MTQTAPRGGARSQKQGLKTQGFPASFGGSRTVAKRKVSALDLSAQLAFLSRNLVCSFDFLVAEQFFSWMGTANLLQQSSTISKNQKNFLLRGCKYFRGHWVGNLFALEGGNAFEKYSNFWSGFGSQFWDPFLGTLSCHFSFQGPKIDPQKWTPKLGLKI